MARKIVGLVQPFALRQNFYVYEDGNKLVFATPKVEEINDTIFSLMQQYDVTEVHLIGAKQFNKGLSKKLQEAEMSKFNSNKLEIIIE